MMLFFGKHGGLEIQTLANWWTPWRIELQNQEYYFRNGIAFSMIGANFSARVHRYPSIFDDKGSSIFSKKYTASSMRDELQKRARSILESLNPSVHFQVGDVNRLPLFPIANAEEIFATLEKAFGIHEAHREPSVEFKEPGPSPWRGAQEWAQRAVDRGEGEALPEYVEVLDAELASDHMSYALGVALGRFGGGRETAQGGMLFLDGTLEEGDWRDGLGGEHGEGLRAAWGRYGEEIAPKMGLREWLGTKFFGDVHKGMYENRPIHWPLSSENKTFVVWVNIHRFTEQTLRIILADWLYPTQARMEGELRDLREAKERGEKKAARNAEKIYEKKRKAKDELQTFISDVEQCADRGPLPTDAKCPPRQRDARYAPNLDDGVMINSAALWKLLEPQWKDPKKWWKELASASGKKDYDWSHLAMRYWPTRVDAKCQQDPSLAVAHGCFWQYHPARAWAWELRLQDEIAPDFRIQEADATPTRSHWLQTNPSDAFTAIEKEATRRMGRAKSKKLVPTMTILEPGLWTAHPLLIWDMELKLSEKQGAEFRLLSPDEPQARSDFETKNPTLVQDRRQKIASLVPPPDMFDTDEDAEETEAEEE